jgi:hypothetical protein
VKHASVMRKITAMLQSAGQRSFCRRVERLKFHALGPGSKIPQSVTNCGNRLLTPQLKQAVLSRVRNKGDQGAASGLEPGETDGYCFLVARR